MRGFVLDIYPLAANSLPNIDPSKLKLALAEHLRQYWGGINEAVPLLNESIVEVSRSLKGVIQAFSLPGVDDSRILLMVLCNVIQPNGHAFIFDGIGVAYYAIKEGYSLEYHHVFSTHEVIHAIHYQMSPTCYFNTVEWQQNTGRQLLAEGIATTLTAQVLNISVAKALWADILPHDEIDRWINVCEQSQDELSSIALAMFNQSSPPGMFDYVQGADPMNNRSGYWIGARFIQHLLTQGWSTSEILTASYSRLSPILREWLCRSVC